MTRRRPASDPSVEFEPHLRDGPLRGDPNDPAPAASPPARFGTDAERAVQGVWAEPALSLELAPAPAAGDQDFGGWWDARAVRWTPARSAAVTALLAAAAGALAVPAALIGNTLAALDTWSAAVLVAVLAPAVEEPLKIALAWWAVEQRPYLFRSPGQVRIAALGGGLGFGLLENLWYQFLVIPNAVQAGALPAADVDGLLLWRWTVCSAMHVVASAVAGVGLARAWSEARERRQPVRTVRLAPFLSAAVVIHGAYNGSALLFEIGSRWV